MKKLLTTLPSTKPDHFFKSQMSEEGFLTYRKVSYRTQLLQLIQSMKSICRNRLVFLFRDIQLVYQQNEQLLKDILRVRSSKQLWEHCSDGQKMNQQHQIQFLISLLQELNLRKMSEGDYGNIEKADHYRHLVDWFIKEIVQYEKQFLKEVEKQQLREWEITKQQRLTECLRQQQRSISAFDGGDYNRQIELMNRFRRQHVQREREFRDRTERQIYKINPSLKLKQTKEKVLYKKLGAYRINKSNPYENRGLRKDLQKAVQTDEERKIRLIDRMKHFQKTKLLKHQRIVNDSQELTAQISRGKLVTNMSLERDLLGHYQNHLRDNMRHSLQMSRNRKLSNLKNTLEAFIQHEDQAKVSEILDTQERKIRHNSNISEVIATQAFANRLQNRSGRYSTLQGEAHTIQKQLGRQNRYFGKRIKDIFVQEHKSNEPTSPTFLGRKSLVDLYDKQLNLV